MASLLVLALKMLKSMAINSNTLRSPVKLASQHKLDCTAQKQLTKWKKMTKEVQKQTENKHTESTNNMKEDVEIKG